MTDETEQQERHACGLHEGRVSCIWSVVRMACAMLGAAVTGAVWCVVRIVVDWWWARR